MCGIAGLALGDPRERPDARSLERMAAAIAHRGPDEQSTLALGPLGLAFRRLSIIDVVGGGQPFVAHDGQVALIGNGEIYNAPSLRRELEQRGHRFRSASDVESILHLYLEHGTAGFRELVGMYACAIADLRGARPKLVLLRDRLGIKPLYWARLGADLAFASEPKALLALGRSPRALRASALLDYLVQGYVGGPQAAWSGMQRLPPACFLEWECGGEPRVERYWDLPLEGTREPAPAREILEQLDLVVREHLASDVPLGAFLSGGIDSNAVVDSMTRASGRGPIACSVGFREASHDELEIARASARRVGAVHHTAVLEADPRLALDVLPWHFDEPLADPSTLPTYLVSRMAREHVTVALSGDGGDEVFAGYRRYVHDWAENRVRERVGPAGRALARGLGARYPHLARAPRPLRARTFLTNVGSNPARAYWRSVCPLEREHALALLAPDLRARLASHDPFEAFRAHYERPRGVDALYRAQYADFHTYLPDQILAKVDRASMAVSLEVRPPLLDHRFVERFAHLPAREKVRGGRGKVALREALRARLPSEVLDGAKRGFDTPLASWLRGPLAPSAAEAIESLPERWFARAELRARLAEHAAGRRDHGRLLWSLLVLEHWRRRHSVEAELA